MKQTETSFWALLSRMFLLWVKDGARISCIVRKVPFFPTNNQNKKKALSWVQVVGRFNLEYPFDIAEKSHIALICF